MCASPMNVMNRNLVITCQISHEHRNKKINKFGTFWDLIIKHLIGQNKTQHWWEYTGNGHIISKHKSYPIRGNGIIYINHMIKRDQFSIWFVIIFIILLPLAVICSYFISYQIYNLFLYHICVNSLRAKLFRGNINVYLHFMSLLHIDMAQVLKILPQVRPGLTYST